ncbi:hypothetical protein [Burkholderia pseudomallei]|uniref:hypothetical protein n=1 Tax=Burkholderia pseudomallei TaxID=28450 RepID=UPI00201B19A0|nr:hypothetical protein [Burkholderia pseudomallei]MCL4670370.1 hypothetical protein [Burkholderia pseudomallei]
MTPLGSTSLGEMSPLAEMVKSLMVMAVMVRIRGMARILETTMTKASFPLMVPHRPADLQARVEN